MNCYAGLAKRLIKSCFPPIIPVPQLEPLDARLIIKQEVKDNNTNKACFALSDAHERVFKPISFKPISDEEAWEATLAWAEAKAQERETKTASQTDTDESYDSDDDDDDYEAIRDMIMRLEKRITREKEKSLLKTMLESQSLSDDDTDNE
jgi:hypothetical protein